MLVAPSGPRAGHGKVVRRLGRPDVARDVIEALMLDRGLRRRFDPAVERAARAAAPSAAARRRRRARDLRDLPTFTIDPPTARDFDDAISRRARSTAARMRVWVHIADVAAHVPPGSPVDREAHRRATSVYVPGAVEPMLPEALSNDACSLVPARGAPRGHGRARPRRREACVRRRSTARTIRSDARLDYPQVDRDLRRRRAAPRSRGRRRWPPRARRAARARRRRARRAGALEVESAEPEFDVQRRGPRDRRWRRASRPSRTG